MKKSTSFLFCLIIILCFAAFVFYTGWTQFKVPAGSVGILVSKTSGVKEMPASNERFSWDWEWLLPTNAELKIFSQKAVNFEKSVAGVLPSGREYAAVFGDGLDFSYRFNFAVSVVPSEGDILRLVKEKKLSGEADLEKYFEDAAETAARQAVTDIIERILDSDESASIRGIVDGSRALAVTRDGGSSDGGNTDASFSLSLKDYSLPDISLYRQAAESYVEYARQRQADAAESARKAEEETSRFNQTIRKMETLGDTLKKYPELSDILKNSDSINRTLQTIDSLE